MHCTNGYQSTRHTRLITQSLVTNEHITKPPVENFFICMPVRQHPETVLNREDVITPGKHTRRTHLDFSGPIDSNGRASTPGWATSGKLSGKQCCAVRFGYLGLMYEISKSPMTAKLLNVTNARSKSRSLVNSGQVAD